MNTLERDAFFDELVAGFGAGELSWGQVIRALRVEVAGMNQDVFARATKISVRTLRQLETDTGNPTLSTLDAVLKPFGLDIGLVRRG